jgi:hypothetical protein
MEQQKQKSVSPEVAIAVLLFYGALLVLWLWARGQSMGVLAPVQMAPLSNGAALVSFQKHLYRVAPDGTVGAGVNLPHLSGAVGMAVRDADDVFVYRGGEKRVTFMDHIRTYVRDEDRTLQPEVAEGIYLCRLSLGTCSAFSEQFLVTGSARMLWDTAHQHLVIADTGHHVLDILDNQGQLLRTIHGVHYPNGIWQQGNTLLVADTNHHRIASVDLDKLSAPATAKEIHPEPSPDFDCNLLLTAPASSLLMDICSTRYHDYTWPSGVTRVGTQYWVLVADHNMSNSRLYRYDNDWNLIGRSALTLGDIVNLVPLGKGALVLDFSVPSLWRLDAVGKKIAQVWLPGMEKMQAAHRHWQQLAMIFLVLLIVSFVAGFAFAVWDKYFRQEGVTQYLNMQVQAQAQMDAKVVAKTEKSTPEPTTETWFEQSSTVRNRHWMLAAIPLIFLMGYLMLGTNSHTPLKDELKFLAMSVAMMLILACSWLLLNYVGRSKLGTKGSLVLLSPPNGKVVVGKGAQIRYSGSLLVIDDVIMPLGNWRNILKSKKDGLWKREQLNNLLAPALQDAKKLGVLEAKKLIWRLRFWPLMSFDFLILLMAVVMVGLAVAKQSGLIGH